VLVKACLNGSRGREEHPAVPLAPGELAAEARAAMDAGAGALHIHPRAEDGRETLHADEVAAALAAVRSACPGVSIGISTGAWITDGDPEQRLVLVRGLVAGARPDFASVNLSEPAPKPLLRALRDLQIGIEAGVWTSDDADVLAGLGPAADGLIRILIEPQEPQPHDALATVAAIEAALDAQAVPGPRLHHGYGRATWHVLRQAVVRRRDIRVGLEDTLELPDGRRARGNADLVAAAVELTRRA
jgi:uncharacterized protein (DUF849 family)